MTEKENAFESIGSTKQRMRDGNGVDMFITHLCLELFFRFFFFFENVNLLIGYFEKYKFKLMMSTE